MTETITSAESTPMLFPVLATPILPDQTPYTGLLVWLSITPKVDATSLDASADISWLPYRVLANGMIDTAPETMRQRMTVASANQTAIDDPMMGQAIAAISGILQQMLAAGQ